MSARSIVESVSNVQTAVQIMRYLNWDEENPHVAALIQNPEELARREVNPEEYYAGRRPDLFQRYGLAGSTAFAAKGWPPLVTWFDEDTDDLAAWMLEPDRKRPRTPVAGDAF